MASAKLPDRGIATQGVMSRKVGENFTRNTWLGVPDSAGVGTFQSKKGCFRCFWPTESAKKCSSSYSTEEIGTPSPSKAGVLCGY